MENFKIDTKTNTSQPIGNPNPWPIAVKFGIAGAAFFILLNLVQYLSGMMDLENMMDSGNFTFGKIMMGLGLTVVNWIVFTLIYFLAVKAYRTELGGFISFGEGFKVAFFSALIKAAILLVWGIIFFYFINPGFCESMLNIMGEALNQAGTDENSMEMMMKMYSYMYNPIGMAIMQAFNTITGGAILSLAAAAIGQKEKS